jgi:hypothetical protein
LYLRTFVQNVWWSCCGCEYCMTIGKADWKTFNRRSITCDKLWSGHTCSVVMSHSICWVDELICNDQHITTHELCSTLSFSKGSVMMVVEKVVCSKVCTHWVPRMLMDACKKNLVATDLLHQFGTGAEGFLSQIVMGDETWVHYFELESKWLLIDWCCMTYQQRRRNSRMCHQLKRCGCICLGWNGFMWTYGQEGQ